MWQQDNCDDTCEENKTSRNIRLQGTLVTLFRSNNELDRQQQKQVNIVKAAVYTNLVLVEEDNKCCCLYAIWSCTYFCLSIISVLRPGCENQLQQNVKFIEDSST